ncbi:hypothetical protein I7I50_00342 [Histoplasma capsulatum G186AR]|uniref:Uncharacterized protein n=1 Tax=Ajellomyces capsulatus TaxID=5037 RepID=A0A8H8CUU3_AJECA|nr:hypothetical protein I7I52_07610 [Histoplasma capsulatum]QSS72482.1 hypothetical protein I7I50_00342 [Histoplasma capsulatum G186AR]
MNERERKEIRDAETNGARTHQLVRKNTGKSQRMSKSPDRAQLDISQFLKCYPTILDGGISFILCLPPQHPFWSEPYILHSTK